MSDHSKGPWGQRPSKLPPSTLPEQTEEFEQLWRKGQERIRRVFPGGNRPTIPVSTIRRFALIMGGLLLLWLASGVYTVGPKEEAIVMLFGKHVRTESSGLKYHWPTPFESVIKINVTERYVNRVGTAMDTNAVGQETGGHGVLMLTGDENIVDISFEVQWQIADSHKYLFNVADPVQTVEDAAESAMREVIATTPINDVLSEDRLAVQLQTKKVLQEILDSYEAGISIKEINMKAIPPSSNIAVDVLPSATGLSSGEVKTSRMVTTVADAFRDVQAALNNKQETINIAQGYANQQVPIARGEAQKILQDAKGYAQAVVEEAKGEAKRFSAVYEEYKKAKDVTKKRLYLETMEAVLPNIDKTIMDKEAGKQVLPYIQLQGTSK